MNKWYKILLGLVGIGVASAAGLTLNQPPTIDQIETQLESQISADQQAQFNQTGRYKTVDATTTPSGIEYSVDTIVVWDGHDTPQNVGYEVHIQKPDNTDKKFGVGSLAPSLSHNWQAEPVIITHPSSTSTP